jgi:hypothetical protein
VQVVNQTNNDMAEAKLIPIESTLERVSPPRSTGLPARTAFFKYYIHDGINTCRLELLGELTQQHLPEMSGCWQTAKTTLGSRQLILDLRRLQDADADGRRWLASMAQEGASCLPDSFLTNDDPREPSKQSAAVKLSLLGRVLGLLRNVCAAPAE